MSPRVRLGAFAALLALLFGAAAAAGSAVGPDPEPARAPGHDAGTDRAHGAAPHAPAGGSATPAVRGLAVAEGGLRLVVADPELAPGRPELLAFRVVDAAGRTVRDFDVTHTKRMHLILARRDLTGFQHLHPEQRADGTWVVRARVEEPGSYRLLADFERDGRALTLAADLRVDGRARLRPLPAPRSVARSDGGYEVRLDPGKVRPGREALLSFAITRDGAPVHPEPYLGAGGHLVALREGDLAFLHVHPTEDGHGESHGAGHDDAVGFAASFPTAGRYGLFLQFRHEGRVHTVVFTQEVR